MELLNVSFDLFVCNDSFILSTLVGGLLSKNHSHSQMLNVLSIYLHIWVVLGVNVRKYTIHWAFGIGKTGSGSMMECLKSAVQRLEPSSCFGCFCPGSHLVVAQSLTSNCLSLFKDV